MRKGAYVSAMDLKRAFGWPWHIVRKLAEQGDLGTVEFPGNAGRRRYSKADAERIAKEMVKPSKVAAGVK